MFLPLFGKTQLITISGNVLHSKNGKALKNYTTLLVELEPEINSKRNQKNPE